MCALGYRQPEENGTNQTRIDRQPPMLGADPHADSMEPSGPKSDHSETATQQPVRENRG